jgi:hypothetical protein
MSSETAQFRSAYVSIVLLWLLAQQAPAAGNQDTPLRHGTLLLRYVERSLVHIYNNVVSGRGLGMPAFKVNYCSLHPAAALADSQFHHPARQTTGRTRKQKLATTT